jgi:hypothetical protein
MKKIIIYIICFLSQSSYAQIHNKDAKRDNIWEIGYNLSTWNDPMWSINHLNFSNNQPIQTRKDTRFIRYFRSSASICDTTGNFLFSTNGIYIYDASGNKMQGSNFVCSGSWVTDFVNDGYAGLDACMILPAPGHPNLYYNFQVCMFDSQIPPFWATGLNYNTIDMSGNNGLGTVTQQSQSIIANDTLDTGKISACRHANGRDWWIFVWRGSEYTENACGKILLDAQGLHFLGWYNDGSSPQPGAGQTLFSPDGTKHIRYYPYGWHTIEDNCLDIFDFDRCTGELTNYTPIRYMDSVYSAGAAVSPNSRYLYLSVHNRVYQFDLQAHDILTSKVTVATYDGFIDPAFSSGRTYFNTMRLAPDGKIYINCTNGVHYMHIIQNPDVGGIGCNVQQHGLHLLTYNLFAMPNFPHFRLGAQTGSGCDTLNVGTEQAAASILQIKAFPNPTSNLCTVFVQGEHSVLEITVTDAIGRTLNISSIPEKSNQAIISFETMPVGLYILTLRDSNGTIAHQQKLLVIK